MRNDNEMIIPGSVPRSLATLALLFAFAGCKCPDGAWSVPKTPPKENRTTLTGTVTDPSGNQTEVEIEFFEGAGVDDDPTQPGGSGETLIETGLDGAVVHPIEDGDLSGAIALGQVACGNEYLVSGGSVTGSNNINCGGGPAMAAEFERVKARVLAQAIEVVKACWRHPSCQSHIVFQGSRRNCGQGADGDWYLSCYYEVRVVCFTL